ncbi:DUF2029 domain-containing protein [Candidatus Roizmanbacteria bacterium]|nr:DUF2029 domain-containing protein [Candidatus Roizmanbacteria bacterium]
MNLSFPLSPRERWIHRVFFGFIFFIVLGFVILVSAQLTSRFATTDFRAQYTGAVLLSQGEGKNLYRLSTQTQVQKQFAPIRREEQLLPFLNPPFVAAVLTPLALVPFSTAYIIFAGSNLLFVCLIFFLTQKIQTRNASTDYVGIPLLITAYLPFWVTVINGQFSLVLSVSVLGGMLLLLHKRNWEAGVVLSLLLVKPYFLIFPLIYFMKVRNWRTLVGLGTGICSLIMVSFCLVGSTGMKEYLLLLMQASHWINEYGTNTAAQLTGFKFFQGYVSQMSISILSFLGIAWLFMRMSRTEWAQMPVLQVWSILLLGGFILSPHTHYHDLSLLFPVVLLLYRETYLFILAMLLSLCLFYAVPEVGYGAFILIFLAILKKR